MNAKLATLKKWTLLLLCFSQTIWARPSHPMTRVDSANSVQNFQRPRDLCTGDKIYTRDGYSGQVVGLYLYRNQVEVKIDGSRGFTDSYRTQEIGLTFGCLQRGISCVGQSVYHDGYNGIIAAIFPYTDEVYVDYLDGSWPELVNARDLAFSDSCRRLGRCPRDNGRISIGY